MTGVDDKTATVVENGNGPYARFVTAGHQVIAADEADLNCLVFACILLKTVSSRG